MGIERLVLMGIIKLLIIVQGCTSTVVYGTLPLQLIAFS